MRIRTSELCAAILQLIIAAILVGFSRGLPMVEEESPGPRFLPVVLAIIMTILAVLYLLECSKSKEKSKNAKILPQNWKPILYVLSALIIVLLWDDFGAIPTVFVISAFQFKVIEGLPWKKSVIIALIISAGSFVLFNTILGFSLPSGVLSVLL